MGAKFTANNKRKFLNVTSIQLNQCKKRTHSNTGNTSKNNIDEKSRKTYSAYVQLNNEYFLHIMSILKAYIGWQPSNVNEELNMNRFYKWSQYGLRAQKCRNKTMCSYSVGHESRTCQNRKKLTCCNLYGSK